MSNATGPATTLPLLPDRRRLNLREMVHLPDAPVQGPRHRRVLQHIGRVNIDNDVQRPRRRRASRSSTRCARTARPWASCRSGCRRATKSRPFQTVRAVRKSKFYGASLNRRATSTPSTRRLLDGVAMPISSPLDGPARPRVGHPTHWLISTRFASATASPSGDRGHQKWPMPGSRRCVSIPRRTATTRCPSARCSGGTATSCTIFLKERNVGGARGGRAATPAPTCCGTTTARSARSTSRRGRRRAATTRRRTNSSCGTS